MIDGRTVYTPLFAGVYWEMQDTLIEDIDRIEVIRGPGGTIWGANAVNGVINIITLSSRDTLGSLVTATGGNVEQGAVAARYGGGDAAFAYRIWGKSFTRAPAYHPDGRNFDDWRRCRRVSGSIGQQRTAIISWSPAVLTAWKLEPSSASVPIHRRLSSTRKETPTSPASM
jgi:outer membrane receptor protein involved in Fe transport